MFSMMQTRRTRKAERKRKLFNKNAGSKSLVVRKTLKKPRSAS